MSPPLSVLRHIVTEAKRHFGQAMADYVDARIQPAHSSIIQQRAGSGDPESWTAKLFAKGLDKAAQKLG